MMPETDVSTEDLRRSKNAVFRLLKVRLRSEQEIRERLKRKQFPREIIEKTIQYFKELALVDDRQFAQKWISSRLLRPFGINRIKYELKTKGIQDGIIQEELKKITDNYPEEEIVLNLARKQAAKHKNIAPDKLKQRVYGCLARKGFRSEIILKAMKKLEI